MSTPKEQYHAMLDELDAETKMGLASDEQRRLDEYMNENPKVCKLVNAALKRLPRGPYGWSAREKLTARTIVEQLVYDAIHTFRRDNV